MRAVNLIPGDQRSGAPVGAGRSEGAAYAVLALLVIVAGLALLYGKATRSVSSDKTKAATLTAEAQRAQAEASTLAPYTSFASLREQREKAVATLVDQRFDWAHAIHEFGRVLTNQVSISELNGTIAGTTGTAAPAPAPAPAPASPASASSSTTASASATTASPAASAAVTSATPAGSVPTFAIAGCATSQHAVADTIQRLRLIGGVSAVTLQSSTRGASGSGSAPGACGSGPVFQMTVTFDPLPSAAASASAVKAKAGSVADIVGSGSAPTAASPAPSPAAEGGTPR
jgi:Tfp pilus assembly protein PilN